MNTPIIFADAAVTAAPAATTTTTQPAAPAEGAAAPEPQKPQIGGGLSMFVPMLLIFALFYFMMVKPQQRKEKERLKMIDDLRAGKTVVFAGGFIGKIVEAKEKTFKIEIAGDVVVEVARSAVQTIVEE